MVDTRKSFVDKTFRRPDGKLGIGQKPNLPLLIWLVASGLGLVIKHGTAHRLLHDLGLGAITIWAILEILQGVNYFRRALGLIVLAASIMGLFK